jgi:hypothetical protein
MRLRRNVDVTVPETYVTVFLGAISSIGVGVEFGASNGT